MPMRRRRRSRWSTSRLKRHQMVRRTSEPAAAVLEAMNKYLKVSAVATDAGWSRNSCRAPPAAGTIGPGTYPHHCTVLGRTSCARRDRGRLVAAFAVLAMRLALPRRPTSTRARPSNRDRGTPLREPIDRRPTRDPLSRQVHPGQSDRHPSADARRRTSGGLGLRL